jgi:hypothetical protein
MVSTSRRPRPLVRNEGHRDARLIVIATEGQKTEKIYFDAFQNQRLKILTLVTEGGRSSPEAVFDRLRIFATEYQIGADDELWIVIDRDRWSEKTLSEIAQECHSGRTRLALSNPCFEIWLAYHYLAEVPAEIDSTSAEGYFRTLHGSFSKGKYDATPLVSRVIDAIERAAAADFNPAARWPDAPGTRVYKLMKSVLKII